MAYLDTHGLQTLWTKIKTLVNTKSSVSVSSTGTSTSEIRYITIDGVEKKIAGGTSGAELVSNKVTSISSSSTDTQYPSAKCVYDAFSDFTTLGVDVVGNKLVITTEGRLTNGDLLIY